MSVKEQLECIVVWRFVGALFGTKKRSIEESVQELLLQTVIDIRLQGLTSFPRLCGLGKVEAARQEIRSRDENVLAKMIVRKNRETPRQRTARS